MSLSNRQKWKSICKNQVMTSLTSYGSNGLPSLAIINKLWLSIENTRGQFIVWPIRRNRYFLPWVTRTTCFWLKFENFAAFFDPSVIVKKIPAIFAGNLLISGQKLLNKIKSVQKYKVYVRFFFFSKELVWVNLHQRGNYFYFNCTGRKLKNIRIWVCKSGHLFLHP